MGFVLAAVMNKGINFIATARWKQTIPGISAGKKHPAGKENTRHSRSTAFLIIVLSGFRGFRTDH